MKIIFVDRDGTLIKEPADCQIDSLEKLEFVPGVILGLQRLVRAGYSLAMVTNQDHLGSPAYPRAAFELVQNKILGLLSGEGIDFERVFICPHGPHDGCACRKPRTGLVDDWIRTVSVDRQRSWVIGDRETDVEFAQSLSFRSLRLTPSQESRAEYVSPYFMQLCDHILRNDRVGSVTRKTNETDITIDVSLDGTGPSSVVTGIGFFDHMLMQIATHAGMQLTVRVAGDLHVDEHHTVEDTGRALGEAIRLALGSKKGIARYGFIAPLDESLGHVVLDLSGRPHCTFEGRFNRERVGDFPTELTEEFFRAFSDGLRATIHVNVRGTNDHHQIESVFKASARSLRQAIARDESDAEVPSSKGSI